MVDDVPLSRIRKIIHLRPSDWALLAKALVLTATMRVALSLCSFSTVLAWVERAAGRRSPRTPSRDEVRHVAWAVSVASRFVIAATCLTQALAAKCILDRRGISSTLRMGMAKAGPATIEGHAWLECE